jgi:undecaprenyl-diphosphatase
LFRGVKWRAGEDGILAVTDFVAGLDVSIFRALNDFCGFNPTLDRIVIDLEVLRGSLFMGIVGVCGTGRTRRCRGGTILITILAVALSLLANMAPSKSRSRPAFSFRKRMVRPR